MIDWPSELISAIARRRAVVYLGAGVSANSLGKDGKTRPPMWETFLRQGLSRCGSRDSKDIKRLIDKKDYLASCQLIKESLDDKWTSLIKDCFLKPAFKPADIHRHIYKLDASLVLTQNFDKIYDNFAQAESNGTIVTKNYSDPDIADVVKGDSRVVLKVHGTIDTPTSMIFTQNEYIAARRKNPAFYHLIDALIVTHTFLFVGCGLDDPDVRIFLERNVQLFPDSAPHYMTMTEPVSDSFRKLVRGNFSLKVLEYSSATHHLELTRSLEELVERVAAERDQLSRTQGW